MSLLLRHVRAATVLTLALGVTGCLYVLETDRKQLLVESVSILDGPGHEGPPAVRVRYWKPTCTNTERVTVVRVDRVIFVQAYAKQHMSCLFASSTLVTAVHVLLDPPLGPVTVRVRQPDGQTRELALVIGTGD